MANQSVENIPLTVTIDWLGKETLPYQVPTFEADDIRNEVCDFIESAFPDAVGTLDRTQILPPVKMLSVYGLGHNPNAWSILVPMKMQCTQSPNPIPYPHLSSTQFASTVALASR